MASHRGQWALTSRRVLNEFDNRMNCLIVAPLVGSLHTDGIIPQELKTDINQASLLQYKRELLLEHLRSQSLDVLESFCLHLKKTAKSVPAPLHSQLADDILQYIHHHHHHHPHLCGCRKRPPSRLPACTCRPSTGMESVEERELCAESLDSRCTASSGVSPPRVRSQSRYSPSKGFDCHRSLEGCCNEPGVVCDLHTECGCSYHEPLQGSHSKCASTSNKELYNLPTSKELMLSKTEDLSEGCESDRARLIESTRAVVMPHHSVRIGPTITSTIQGQPKSFEHTMHRDGSVKETSQMPRLPVASSGRVRERRSAADPQPSQHSHPQASPRSPVAGSPDGSAPCLPPLNLPSPLSPPLISPGLLLPLSQMEAVGGCLDDDSSHLSLGIFEAMGHALWESSREQETPCILPDQLLGSLHSEKREDASTCVANDLTLEPSLTSEPPHPHLSPKACSGELMPPGPLSTLRPLPKVQPTRILTHAKSRLFALQMRKLRTSFADRALSTARRILRSNRLPLDLRLLGVQSVLPSSVGAIPILLQCLRMSDRQDCANPLMHKCGLHYRLVWSYKRAGNMAAAREHADAGVQMGWQIEGGLGPVQAESYSARLGYHERKNTITERQLEELEAQHQKALAMSRHSSQPECLVRTVLEAAMIKMRLALHYHLPRPSTDHRPRPSIDERPHLSTDHRPRPSTDSRPRPSTDHRPHPSSDERPHLSTDHRPRPSTDHRPRPSTDSRPRPSTDHRPHPSSDERPHLSTDSRPRPSSDGLVKLNEATAILDNMQEARKHFQYSDWAFYFQIRCQGSIILNEREQAEKFAKKSISYHMRSGRCSDAKEVSNMLQA